MALVIVTLIIYYAACLTSGNARPFHDSLYRIVNGTDAHKYEFPWMAMIMDTNGIHICGATLITPRHVLTASHCTIGHPLVKPPNILVRLGGFSINPSIWDPEETVLRILRVHRHPKYEVVFDYDYAILELEFAVNFSRAIQPICLAPQETHFTGQFATATGWGQTNENKLSQVLQKVTVPVWDHEKCKKTYEENNQVVNEAMLCAGEPGKDTCFMDSGGPLVWKNKNHQSFLIGVISWGEKECSSNEFPGVYADVAFANSWIRDTVGGTASVCP